VVLRASAASSRDGAGAASRRRSRAGGAPAGTGALRRLLRRDAARARRCRSVQREAAGRLRPDPAGRLHEAAPFHQRTARSVRLRRASKLQSVTGRHRAGLDGSRARVHSSARSPQRGRHAVLRQTVPEVARAFGASAEDGRALALLEYAVDYPHMPAAYRSSECHPGGSLDLTPGTGWWR
jgi:hypothetical protein